MRSAKDEASVVYRKSVAPKQMSIQSHPVRLAGGWGRCLKAKMPVINRTAMKTKMSMVSIGRIMMLIDISFAKYSIDISYE